MSDTECTYQLLKDVIIPVTAILIAAIVSFFIARYSLKKLLTQQTLSELLNEYRSPEMGDAIISLWQFYEKNCHCNTVELIKEYAEKVKNEIDKDSSSELHNQRRIVSQYYQLLATYYYYKIIPRKRVKELWKKKDLKIINEILYPIEKDSMPKVLGSKPTGKVSKQVEYMHCLYTDMK